ncbi:MAG: MMPL family transporter [Actinomycetales bacterium]|uniref:MMPL family transporter n=1 Tax=Candidatus Phosphoribacter hodrii TaxID=2953743 RepID=A0A934X3K3_9MICO|nr:MMPL family transporter [Candidatus Phosphoribacter hodrii]
MTTRLGAARPDLQVGQIGPGSITREFDATLGRDFQRAEFVSLPVTLVILLIAFGAVVAAGVPLVLGIGSVAVALGLTAAVSNHLVTVDQNTQSMVLLIGLAVGVDYALFVMRRAREERAAGASVEDSIVLAGATAGRAVIVSGLTVMVAMSGMLVAGGLFTSLAIGTSLVVGVAVLASATVLPALLAVLGDRVDALRLPGTRRRQANAGSVESRWGRLAGRVVARPVAWAATAAVALIALSVPALGMRTALTDVEGLPKDLAVVAAYRQLSAAAPTKTVALLLTVKAPASAAPAVAEALAAAAPRAAALAHVSGVQPQASVSKDGTVTLLPIGVALDASDERLPGVVDAVRTQVAPQVTAALRGRPGVEVVVGGEAAATDLAQWMDSRLPWVVGFVLILTLVVMLISFGSPWLAGHRRPQPPFGGRGLRRDDARLPGDVGRAAAGLHLDRVDCRVAAAADVRRAVRVVDGLPRLRHQPGAGSPRCRARRAGCRSTRGGQVGRRRDERRSRHGRGVRGVRDAVRARAQATRSGAGRRRAAGCDGRPGRPAAGRPRAAG